MIKEQKILAVEYTAIILLWSLVIISPLLFNDDFRQNWTAVHIMWVECFVVGVAFLINRFLLMPRLFFAKKYAKYVVSLIILLLILSVFVLYFDGVNKILSLFSDNPIEPFTPSRGDMPPRPMPGGGPPPGGGNMGGNVGGNMGGSMSGLNIDGRSSGGRNIPPLLIPPTSVIPPAITVLSLSVIVIALDMGLGIAVKWIIAEQKQSEIKKERIMAQLSNLQSQVSPHFFMNTLNNIHALVDIDPSRAKQTIIELSSLMDYLLYESSNKENVSLQRELDFISSYISLMRLRFSRQVLIDFSYDNFVPPIKIPPLLFLNFIENAFKYGVDYERDSFIKIRFNFYDDSIEMKAVNSNHSQNVDRIRHGLGISNSRKRLELLYGANYTLDLIENNDTYSVILKIPTL